jgi:hypothetical protein
MAVLAFGLDRLERRIGEDRVVAPDAKTARLAGLLPAYSGHGPADDQPAVIAWLFMVNAVSGTSAA